MTFGVEFPRVDPQLQGDLGGDVPKTAGADCSLKVIQGLVRWATKGAIIPTVAQIRLALGNPTNPDTGKPRGLTVAEIDKAYGLYNVSHQATADMAAIQQALAAGHAVHCCIDYGWVNANVARLSGQKSFVGKHGIGAYGVEQTPPLNPRFTAWLDPLHDRRRAGVPKQIMMATLGELAGAMNAYGPKPWGIIVKRPPAPSLPVDDSAARLAAKNAAFDAVIADAQKGKAI